MEKKSQKHGNSVVKMRDVAALADVSIATVSRYLNGNLDRMSTETANRVADAIDKLNYVPNSAARQMVKKSSGLVAVIAGNIDDFFSTEMFKGINAMLESKGYVGVLFDSNSDLDREKRLMQIVSNQIFDGAILQPYNAVSVIQDTIKRPMPIVIADREIEQSPWPQIVTNNYEIARQATQYYKDKGFKRVIMITSSLTMAANRRDRYYGIQSVINNIDVLEVSEKSYNHKKVLQQLVTLINGSQEDTLIFALKERWLTEFIPRLFYKGLIDDKHVAVTGFSDTGTAQYIDPKTKLISQDPYLIGADSGEVMVNLLEGKKQEPEKIIVPAKFG
ncbi:LacI family DNA-binding transcriptional regulator [Lentilactobacillus kefiri]|uniref:Transcriptional regulator n=2 Tax=Lentilactobacillus kefiri TaxID=33962 RepID=A0A8E1RKN8_LENKE|nr:LacI family DNA-binding transcriptional regulator [Lentilactobacillus kefiri]KRL75501.1 transcriptional regulator [Lentilactobacillus parakefiri DSM 10551]KRM53609.1 transcriptional regulator [Lentilactobacillus kefiri DSM 20587 = JCM 5818]MCJ2161080.1 LacI family transcriptional regulator [Lentilactobacillus kefiri]MCP9369383.1 LacI family DNA-binding transcriptional regulator [Lentilactobacillus kefiri]MDH5109367.1 LacI family DNA-binding transcriptional regulator [Lentilactobacillus kefi